MSDLSAAEICRMLASAPLADLPRLVRAHAADPRVSVSDAVSVARRRIKRERAEDARLERMCELQASLHASGAAVVAGVDEVGRGCLAGPVSAAAVILPVSARIRGLDDSKRIAPDVRVELDGQIRTVALAVSVAHVESTVIDSIGIAAANLLAMKRALAGLGTPVEHAIVDGLPVDLGLPSTAVVGGDRLVAAIAAASIVAKVARDALMREFDREYPAYGFAGNKGYGTSEHMEVIRQIGPCVIHRMSFAPCSQRSLF